VYFFEVTEQLFLKIGISKLLTGACKLHSEELHNFLSSPSIIRMIKSRRMRWAGHVARMEAKRNAYRILTGKPEGKRPLEDQGVGVWIILK
jgi:hypothetical protein